MPNPGVGLTWEVAINDVGYMLADDPSNQVAYRRVISTLEPQRFAAGETPVSEAIERYSFFNSSEWRGGTGQRFLNRAASDQSSFFDAEGVFPFCECQRLHLASAQTFHVTAAPAKNMAVAGSQYLLVQDTGQVEQWTIATDTPTLGNVHAHTAEDLALGYGKGFIATGTALREVTLGAATDNELSTLDVHRVEWIGDRLAVLYRDSGSSTWRFSTLDTAGTEEVVGGHISLPGATNASMGSCEYRLGGMTHGVGFTWFTGWTADGDEGHIYVWGNDITLSASIAMEMPKGEIPIDILHYQGGIYIWAVSANEGVCKIYRALVNGDGTLTPFLVVSDAGNLPDTLLYDGQKLAADGRFIYFAWNDMIAAGGPFSGHGTIDLATGGYVKGGRASNTGDIVSVYTWGNRPGFTASTRGAWQEHSFVLEATGFLKTSIVDADSAVDKRWDSVSFHAEQTANTDVDVEYTLDGGTTYTSVIATETAEEALVALGVEGPSLGLRITLNSSDTSDTPYLRIASTKFHPLGVLDEVLLLPINCSDQIKDLKGAIVARADDVGMAQARALQLLQGNFVSVQDIDYATTAVVTSYEVIQVDVQSSRAAGVQVYDPSQARARSGVIALVSLRREVLTTTATAPSNSAPVITDPGAQGDTVDVLITPLQLAATDADSDPLVWGARTLPTGLTMSRSGLVSGTPTATGVFSTIVYANDGQGGSDSQAITWTIT